MEAKPVENLYGTRPIPVYIAPARGGNEDLSLIDICRVIVQRKWVILMAVLSSVLLAIVYLFFTQPAFKASAYLMPPRQESIQGLLVDYGGMGGFDIKKYTPEFVYDAFLRNLSSRGLRREFFDIHQLAHHYAPGNPNEGIGIDRIFDTKFNKSLQVQADKNDSSFVTVSFSGSDPDLAARWLNQIIEFANERTIHQLYSDVDAAIQANISEVRYQLASKLKLAEQRRLDRIVSLREALRIAKALGIKEVSSFSNITDRNQTGFAVNTAQMPLYMRGTDALEVEVAVLESRKSDEPFISGYRDLQERQAFLEGISIDTDLLSAVTVNEAARVPYVAEKPRVTLVIMLAIVLGVIIGLVAALFVEMLSKAQYETKARGDIV